MSAEGRLDGRTDGSIDVSMYQRMNRWIDGCMHEQMHGWRADE